MGLHCGPGGKVPWIGNLYCQRGQYKVVVQGTGLVCGEKF